MFIVAVPFALVAFFLCWFLKEIPLRKTAYVSTAQPPANGASGTDGATGAAASGAEPAPQELQELPSL